MMPTAFFWPHLVLVSMTTATGLFPSQDVHVSDEADSHDMADGMRHLNIIGLFPFSGSWHGGESMLASTKLAIHQVNNMHILPGYHLHLLPSDTKVGRPKGQGAIEIVATHTLCVSLLQGSGEIKRREVELDPQVSPEEIMSREVELGCESWTSFASGCPSTAVQRTLSL